MTALSATAGSRQGRRTRRRTRTRRRVIVMTVAAAAALLVGAGGATFALWSSDTVFSGGPLKTGDLHLTRGDGVWRQVTPGVEAPASGTLAAGTGSFASMPGDIVEVIVPIRTTVIGENLRARLTVDAGVVLSPELQAGTVTATYRVEKETAEGSVVASAETPLGIAADVVGLDGADGGAIADWNVVVTVEIGGPYIWQAVPQAGPAAWSLDDFVVGLMQVRPAPAIDDAGRTS